MKNKTQENGYLPPMALLTVFSCLDVITASPGEDWELPIIPDEE